MARCAVVGEGTTRGGRAGIPVGRIETPTDRMVG